MAVTHAGKYDYRIVQSAGPTKGIQAVSPNPITTALRTLGLWERDASSKFIPVNTLSRLASHASSSCGLAGYGWLGREIRLTRFCTCRLVLPSTL